MVSLLLTGHGRFSEGLYSSLKMVMGVNDNITYVNFIQGDSSENLKTTLSETIDNLLKTSSRVICLSDIEGGTPFRMCCELSLENDKVMVIAGTNMPLLFQLTSEMEDNDNFDFIKEAIENCHDSISIFELKIKKQDIYDDGI